MWKKWRASRGEYTEHRNPQNLFFFFLVFCFFCLFVLSLKIPIRTKRAWIIAYNVIISARVCRCFESEFLIKFVYVSMPFHSASSVQLRLKSKKLVICCNFVCFIVNSWPWVVLRDYDDNVCDNNKHRWQKKNHFFFSFRFSQIHSLRRAQLILLVFRIFSCPHLVGCALIVCISYVRANWRASNK